VGVSFGSMEGLGKADVERLLNDPSADVRADTAGKVAALFCGSELSPAERVIGEEIFRLMLRDAEVKVRSALSHQLKTSNDLPHDIALALAKDVELVSIPMLECSLVLSDADLVEIIRTESRAPQAAIARRATVSSPVASELVERGDEGVVAALAANDGASLDETILAKAVAQFGGDARVQEALVRRRDLPVTIAEKLVTMVTERLRDYLVTHHELSPDTAADLVLESRERATIALLPSGSQGDVSLERLIEQLHVNGRLTASLVLRALCLGDIPFFEVALARLAGLTLINARVLIHDAGPRGLKAIYQRAKLPEALYPGVRTAFDVAREAQYDGGEKDRERFARRVIERVLTQYDGIDPDSLDYLMRKLEQYTEALG
jgi:uncharacterized protein (DUF2336 family)